MGAVVGSSCAQLTRTTPMRFNTVVRRLLGLQGVRVHDLQIDAAALVVTVDIERRGRSLTCARCGRKHRGGAYDRSARTWRHLDLGAFEVHLRGEIRRLKCRRCDAVVVEAVPRREGE